MGGNISLIGAPGNLIAQAALQDIGLNFAFFDYGKIGLPMLVAGILFFATIGYKLLPDKPSVKTETTFDEEVDYSNVPAWKQYLALVILVLTILAMIFEDVIGINLASFRRYRSDPADPDRGYLRETGHQVNRYADHLPVRRDSVAGKGT